MKPKKGTKSYSSAKPKKLAVGGSVTVEDPNTVIPTTQYDALGNAIENNVFTKPKNTVKPVVSPVVDNTFVSKRKNTFGNVLSDIGAGILKQTVQPIEQTSGMNIVGDKGVVDYTPKSKVGGTWFDNNAVVNSAMSKAAPAAAGIIGTIYGTPAVGAAAYGGVKGAQGLTPNSKKLSSTAVEGTDSKNAMAWLNKNNAAIETGVDVAAGVGMSVAGMGKNKSQANMPALSNSQTISNDNVVSPQSATTQFPAQNNPNTNVYNEDNYVDVQANPQWKSTYSYKHGGKVKSLSAAKAKMMLKDGKAHGQNLSDKQRKYFGFVANGGKPQAKAEGGEIEGAGTAKSDSIKATLDEGGFVVPVENVGQAIALREKYLGNVKKAKLNQGDTPVKLSNGEHYFTPEEVGILTEQGVDLNALAPNQEPDADGKVMGGFINDKNKMLFPITEEGAKNVEPGAFSKSEYPDTKLSRAAADAKGIKQTVVDGDVAQKATFVGTKASATNKGGIMGYLNGGEIKGYKKGGKIVGYQLAENGVDLVPIYHTNNMSKIDTKKVGDISPNRENKDNITVPEYTDSATGSTYKRSNYSNDGGISKYLTGANLSTLGSLAQTGIGLNYLRKAGDRPIDIDRSVTMPGEVGAGLLDFNSAVAKAEQNANYGLTPAEQAAAKAAAENNRRAIVYNSQNAGSAGYANALAAGQQANENNIAIQIADSQLKQQKQQGLMAMLQGRGQYQFNKGQMNLGIQGTNQALGRQKFQDKLDAFNTNQQAGNELLGAGIRNFISSQRERDNNNYMEKYGKYNSQPVYKDRE